MNCYDCATKSETTPAVAICAECGRGLCLEHHVQTRRPAYFDSSAGMATVRRECQYTMPRMLCGECSQTIDCCGETE